METPTLLGYLARFGSFSTQSELLCTQGLVYLLQTHEDARSAMASDIEKRTGVSINSSLTWHAEARQEDLGRPDLEAHSADGVPVVKIEAKLEAALFESQVRSYVNDLQNRNDSRSAMLVLIPEARIKEATEKLAAALDFSGSGPWPVTEARRTGTAVISWEELFDALRGGSTELFRYELEQLHAMYRVLMGGFIAPLADEEDLRQWREREADFVIVIDQVTRRLTTEHAVYPMSREPLEGGQPDSESRGYHRRYVCPVAGSCFSIGVRDSFAEPVTPVWMRFHKDTGTFPQIRQRIVASTVPSLESGGHVWIPLEVPLDVSGEQMIEAIVERSKEIASIALGTPISQ